MGIGCMLRGGVGYSCGVSGLVCVYSGDECSGYVGVIP
jgi:hypothetical protein